MTYTPNIPQGGDRPSDSQPLILSNFTVANTIFGINHFEFNAGANAGKHKFTTYVEQTAPVDPVVNSPDWATFTKKTTFGLVTAPFIRNSVKVWNTPVVIEVADLDTLAGVWNDLFDFGGPDPQPKMMGIIFIIDTGTPDRTITSNFSWDGTTISVPTNFVTSTGSRTKSFRDSDKGAILSSGDDMTSLKFDDITPKPSMLQIWTNVAIHKVRARILGVLI